MDIDIFRVFKLNTTNSKGSFILLLSNTDKKTYTLTAKEAACDRHSLMLLEINMSIHTPPPILL